MPAEKEVLICHCNDLERHAKDGDVQQCEKIFDALQKCQLTIDLLRETKIGLRLRAIGKNEKTPAAVQKRCKLLVKRWRNEFVSHAAASDNASAESPVASPVTPAKGLKRKLSDVSSPTSSPAPQKRKLSRQSSGHMQAVPQDMAKLKVPAIARTGDLTRDKCRVVLWKALNSFVIRDNERGDVGTKELAEEIEAAIHVHHIHDGASAYKVAVKSKASNIKDAANDLRLKILAGKLTPEMLARMTSADMASEAKKKQNADFAKAGMNDALAPQAGGATTDAFKCGKCGKRKCTYYEKQTRSADEPMTVFVSCMNCGNKWRC